MTHLLIHLTQFSFPLFFWVNDVRFWLFLLLRTSTCISDNCFKSKSSINDYLWPFSNAFETKKVLANNKLTSDFDRLVADRTFRHFSYGSGLHVFFGLTLLSIMYVKNQEKSTIKRNKINLRLISISHKTRLIPWREPQSKTWIKSYASLFFDYLVSV